MKLFSLIIIVTIVLAALAGGGLYFLAQKSRVGAPPGIVAGALKPCPDKPNCVCSEDGAPAGQKVAAVPLDEWSALPDKVLNMGGVIVELREDYLAAEFSSPLLGFVDDVEFRKADDAVHVRSASRVGHSDMGANKKRVEALRALMSGPSAPFTP